VRTSVPFRARKESLFAGQLRLAGGLGFDDLVADGVVDQLGQRVEVEF
jgi:hypothetical protein